MSVSPQCQGISKRTGERCTAFAVGGSKLCAGHGATKEHLQQASRKSAEVRRTRVEERPRSVKDAVGKVLERRAPEIAAMSGVFQLSGAQYPNTPLGQLSAWRDAQPAADPLKWLVSQALERIVQLEREVQQWTDKSGIDDIIRQMEEAKRSLSKANVIADALRADLALCRKEREILSRNLSAFTTNA